MKRTAVTLIISLLAFTTVMAFTLGNIDKVKKNMTEKQVSDIMGKPDKKIDAGLLSGKSITIWKYGNSTEITFIDHKVDNVLSAELSPKN